MQIFVPNRRSAIPNLKPGSGGGESSGLLVRRRVRCENIPAAPHRSAVHLALVWKSQVALEDGFPYLRVHQLMNVQTHGLPGICGDIENSCIHADRVLGTYLHAITAIDTHSQINVEADRVLLDIGIGMLARHDRDAFRRANRLA